MGSTEIAKKRKCYSCSDYRYYSASSWFWSCHHTIIINVIDKNKCNQKFLLGRICLFSTCYFLSYCRLQMKPLRSHCKNKCKHHFEGIASLVIPVSIQASYGDLQYCRMGYECFCSLINGGKPLLFITPEVSEIIKTVCPVLYIMAALFKSKLQ